MDAERSAANAWMVRAAGGDRQAFGELAQWAGHALQRFCLSHLPPYQGDGAADAVQETLLRAWQSARKFRPAGDALAWLMGIALNVARERRRQRQAGPLGLIDPPAAQTPPDERLDRLAAAVEALPERQREAVVCRFFRGLSVFQTAEVMGVAEGTVKAAVFKALANLEKTLGD